ncbi:hypothetical protein HED49_00870 [Ochrobactrum daejeonense]|nr:hypothetical protein [Brucella daejeonensis]
METDIPQDFRTHSISQADILETYHGYVSLDCPRAESRADDIDIGSTFILYG